MNKKSLRIAFTGGGSGGHIYPLLAVAQEVSSYLHNANFSGDHYLYYFGSAQRYSQDVIGAGLRIKRVVAPKLRRYFSLKNGLDAILFPIALLQSFWHMFWVMPDILFSKGGSGSLPVVCAAWFFRVPIFVHESDAVAGLSNTITHAVATRAAVSFTRTLQEWDDEKTALVGNPLRPFLLEDVDQLDGPRAKQLFGFDPSLPLILVLGGSLGSVSINDVMFDHVQDFVSKYQVLHVTGPDNFDVLKSELAVATKRFIPEQRQRYKLVSYLSKDIKEALIAADVVISRAGSGALFEIAYFSKPSIIIPLKGSARNHQWYNAQEYASQGACIVIEEDNITPTILFSQLEHIISDTSYAQQMSQAAAEFSKPYAGELIAQELVRIATT